MEKERRVYDLRDRLIQYSMNIIKLAEKLPRTFAGVHLAKQIIRSGTAPALNYGEAQGAESRRDFIHKLKISLKELRETHSALQIVKGTFELGHAELLSDALEETNQLTAIFYQSIETAKRNRTLSKKG